MLVIYISDHETERDQSADEDYKRPEPAAEEIMLIGEVQIQVNVNVIVEIAESTICILDNNGTFTNHHKTVAYLHTIYSGCLYQE